MKKVINWIKLLLGISAAKDAFEFAFEEKERKGWPEFYVFVDIHGTIVRPNYEVDVPKDFYPHAQEVLQMISERKDMKLGLYTCSHQHQIDEYLNFFKSKGIQFDMVNKNPEVKDNKYGNFSGKPYMNVLLEDKAGFNPKIDWKILKKYLTKNKL